jgi:hypothetical protein
MLSEFLLDVIDSWRRWDFDANPIRFGRQLVGWDYLERNAPHLIGTTQLRTFN